MLNLTTIMINSEQPKVLADFYTEVLGEPQWSGGEFVGFRAGTGMLLIGPHSDIHGPNTAPGRLMPTFETDDVAAAFTKLTEAGGTAIAPPYHPDEAEEGGLLATVADPDGNYLQLASPMPDM